MYSPKNAMVVNMPFIVIFLVHLLVILPDILCKFKRKIEAGVIICIIIEFILEIKRVMQFVKAGEGALEAPYNHLAMDAFIRILGWLLVYLHIFNFGSDK